MNPLIVMRMALVRILVDGYSLLHHWPELAPDAPRHSAEARDELVYELTQYRDATGIPITVVFDGSQPRGGKLERPSSPEMEVLFSRAGQTADDIIERVSVRMRPYGEVLVVTDDFAERDTVMYHGGMAVSCQNFIRDIEQARAGQQRDIARHNFLENRRYKNAR